MDDITFCLNGWRKDCMVTRCERHPDNIRDKTIPHSFSEFYKTEYCPLERPKEKDLVEVIRCKDCKHYVIHTFFGRSQGWCERLCDEFDKSLARGTEPDDYCSRAEPYKGEQV